MFRKFLIKTSSRYIITQIRHFSATNHYAVLGVTRNASKDQIKSAYFLLAKKYHPDAPGGSHEKFVELNNSYHALNQKDIAPHTTSESDYEEKWQYYHKKPCPDNSTFKNIDSFYDLEKLLIRRGGIHKLYCLDILVELGRNTLQRIFDHSRILNGSYELALLMINVLEKDRESLVDLIGRDHIAKVLDLADLLEKDWTHGRFRTNRLDIFNKYPLPWEEFKNLYKILGHDTVIKCITRPTLSHFVFDRLSTLFSKTECDQFIDFLGTEGINIYLKTHNGDLSYILKIVSKEMQKKILDCLEPSCLSSEYRSLGCITQTLRVLYPSNYQYFLDMIGKARIENIMKDPDTRTCYKHIVKAFENIIKGHAKIPDEDSSQSKSLNRLKL